MIRFLACAAILAAACFLVSVHSADDDLLIVEQEYKMVDNAKDIGNAKDIRQVLYVTRDFVCIDEFGGSGNTPSESYLIDLKNHRIVDLDHDAKQVLTEESFDDRRTRIEKKRKEHQEDIDAIPPGKQREKMVQLWRAILDTGRDFESEVPPEKHTIAGVECDSIKIFDAHDHAYVPLQASLHPEMKMPYENAEVLFLLMIIGEKLSNYLHDKHNLFDRVPMEMHIDLAAGGKLDTKVLSVKKMARAEFDPKSRPLGDPFSKPADYKPPQQKIGPAAPVEKPRDKPVRPD